MMRCHLVIVPGPAGVDSEAAGQRVKPKLPTPTETFYARLIPALKVPLSLCILHVPNYRRHLRGADPAMEQALTCELAAATRHAGHCSCGASVDVMGFTLFQPWRPHRPQRLLPRRWKSWGRMRACALPKLLPCKGILPVMTRRPTYPPTRRARSGRASCCGRVVADLAREAPRQLLARELLASATGPAAWWGRQQAYARGTAVMSMVGRSHACIAHLCRTSPGMPNRECSLPGAMVKACVEAGGQGGDGGQHLKPDQRQYLTDPHA